MTRKGLAACRTDTGERGQEKVLGKNKKEEGQAQRSRKKIHTIRVYPKMWAPIAGKVGASAAEK